jgi:hypothetical protein
MTQSGHEEANFAVTHKTAVDSRFSKVGSLNVDRGPRTQVIEVVIYP